MIINLINLVLTCLRQWCLQVCQWKDITYLTNECEEYQSVFSSLFRIEALVLTAWWSMITLCKKFTAIITFQLHLFITCIIFKNNVVARFYEVRPTAFWYDDVMTYLTSLHCIITTSAAVPFILHLCYVKCK